MQPQKVKTAAPAEDDWGDFGSAPVAKSAPKAKPKNDDDFGFSDFTSAPASDGFSSFTSAPKTKSAPDSSLFFPSDISFTNNSQNTQNNNRQPSSNDNSFLDFDTLPPVNVFIKPQTQSQPQQQQSQQTQQTQQQSQQPQKLNDDPWAGLVDLSLVDKPKEKRHITMSSGR